MKLNEAQVDRWRILLEEQSADTVWMDDHKRLDERRVRITEEMRHFLDDFMSGAATIEGFRSSFDVKTRNEWEGFGFKGLSGAMFLNKLVKHIPDQAQLTERLHAALAVPGDEQAGRATMKAFLDYLMHLIKDGATTRQLLQPARTPFFLSIWWHVHDTERWPVYYGTAFRTLIAEGCFHPVKDVVEDYFTFRDVFRSLASALDLSAWEFEHLCAWYDERGRGKGTGGGGNGNGGGEKNGGGDDEDDGDDDETKGQEGATHTQTQQLLATIGRKLGCRIWIAKNDHAKEWQGKKLGDLSIPELPNLGMGVDSQKLISLIDVLWLKGANQVVAAFEIEHSTSVYSGLLRMADLTALSPNLFFPLYIVAPKVRLPKVRRELKRPSLQTLELHKRCGFFSSEKLLAEAESIVRWANDPGAIEKLAEHVEDVSGDDSI